jgi:type IV pilus assembly protein PilO
MPLTAVSAAVDAATRPTGPGRLWAPWAGLDPHDPSRWPALPRALLLLGAAVAVWGASWLLVLDAQRQALRQAQSAEATARTAWLDTWRAVQALQDGAQQLDRLRQAVEPLQAPLTPLADWDAGWVDIQTAAHRRRLVFDWVRPGPKVLREHVEEAPVAFRVSGAYADIGQFVSDVAQLERLATLHQVHLLPHPDRPPAVAMEAVARTFRLREDAPAQGAHSQGRP